MALDIHHVMECKLSGFYPLDQEGKGFIQETQFRRSNMTWISISDEVGAGLILWHPRGVYRVSEVIAPVSSVTADIEPRWLVR